MLLEKPSVQTHDPVTKEEAKHVLSTGIWGDAAALKLVVQDSEAASAYAATKEWVAAWPTANSLYQSPFTARYWEGTQVERANIPFFTLATAVNSFVPNVVQELFSEDPPFTIQPKPGTKSAAARANGTLIAYQLEDIGFREEIRLGAMNTALYGTGIWHWGWETFERTRKVFHRKHEPLNIANPLAGLPPTIIEDTDDEIEYEEITEDVDRPFFEHIVNLRHIMVDPSLNVPDIRKAKYVIYRRYMTFEDIEKYRDRPGFNIPSREELLNLFFPPKEEAAVSAGETSFRNSLWDMRSEPRYDDATIDPLNQPLEVLERWDNDRYIMVLQKKAVLCSDENPYGVIPFYSVGWWDVPDAFYGMGLAKTIGSEQRLQQGITNIWVDQASINLNGVYVRIRGKNVPSQPIRISPGKIIDVEDKDGFKPLDRQPAVPEAGQHLALSQSRVEQVSGSNEVSTQGFAGPTGHSNLARTAAGANLIGSGAGNRPADFVDKMAYQVIEPFLYQLHEMNRELMPVKTIRRILDQELQDAYFKQGGDLLELLNSRVSFTIGAGSKMRAKRSMAQALPIMTQYLGSLPVQQALAIAGKKVDVQELIHMMADVAGWQNYNDIIVDMTPQDQQRWQQSQPGAQVQTKVAAQQAMQNQKFQQQQELLDQENTGRAARDVLRKAYEQSASPEEITGEPGGIGFGSQV